MTWIAGIHVIKNQNSLTTPKIPNLRRGEKKGQHNQDISLIPDGLLKLLSGHRGPKNVQELFWGYRQVCEVLGRSARRVEKNFRGPIEMRPPLRTRRDDGVGDMGEDDARTL